jgi:hypothetical protein
MSFLALQLSCELRQADSEPGCERPNLDSRTADLFLPGRGVPSRRGRIPPGSFLENLPVTAIQITDKFSGQSKGFGFVEMADNSEADAAIKALNDTALNGRNIKVNQAKPREQRPARSGGGGGGRRW